MPLHAKRLSCAFQMIHDTSALGCCEYCAFQATGLTDPGLRQLHIQQQLAEKSGYRAPFFSYRMDEDMLSGVLAAHNVNIKSGLDCMILQALAMLLHQAMCSCLRKSQKDRLKYWKTSKSIMELTSQSLTRERSDEVRLWGLTQLHRTPKSAFKMSKLQHPSDFSVNKPTGHSCFVFSQCNRQARGSNRAGPVTWCRGAFFKAYLVNLELGLAQTLQGAARPCGFLLQIANCQPSKQRL